MNKYLNICLSKITRSKPYPFHLVIYYNNTPKKVTFSGTRNINTDTKYKCQDVHQKGRKQKAEASCNLFLSLSEGSYCLLLELLCRRKYLSGNIVQRIHFLRSRTSSSAFSHHVTATPLGLTSKYS